MRALGIGLLDGPGNEGEGPLVDQVTDDRHHHDARGGDEETLAQLAQVVPDGHARLGVVLAPRSLDLRELGHRGLLHLQITGSGRMTSLLG